MHCVRRFFFPFRSAILRQNQEKKVKLANKSEKNGEIETKEGDGNRTGMKSNLEYEVNMNAKPSDGYVPNVYLVSKS